MSSACTLFPSAWEWSSLAEYQHSRILSKSQPVTLYRDVLPLGASLKTLYMRMNSSAFTYTSDKHSLVWKTHGWAPRDLSGVTGGLCASRHEHHRPVSFHCLLLRSQRLAFHVTDVDVAVQRLATASQRHLAEVRVLVPAGIRGICSS